MKKAQNFLLASIVTESAMATNGHRYLINRESGTVKKVSTVANDEFVENDTVEVMDEAIEKQNTKILFRYIKEKHPEAVMKHGRIHVADYKIRYSSHGFEISDGRNFGEVLNVNKFHNDFPTPEAVVDFIDTTLKRPFAEKKQITRDEVKRGELLKMAKYGKIKVIDINTLEVEAVTPEPTKDRLHMETESIFRKFKDGILTFTKAKEKIKNRVPDKIQKECIDLLTNFRRGDITWRKLNIEFTNKIMLPYLEWKKQEKLVRQPKFESPVLWEPENLKLAVTDHAYQAEIKMTRSQIEYVHYEDVALSPTNNGRDLIVEPDIMWMQFDTKGPSGKRHTVVCTVEEYFANVVLHHYPRAMALLMKVAKGEITEMPDMRKLSTTKFIVDPFEAYEPNCLRHPHDREFFCRVCKEILLIDGIDWCFLWHYDNSFNVGDKVRLWSPLYSLMNYGTVVEVGAGVTVRYEYGTIQRVYKGELIEKFEWK